MAAPVCSIPPVTIRDADAARASCGLTMVSTQTRPETRSGDGSARRRQLDSRSSASCDPGGPDDQRWMEVDGVMRYEPAREESAH